MKRPSLAGSSRALLGALCALSLPAVSANAGETSPRREDDARPAKLSRAKDVLGALRSHGEGHTFGGRISESGVDGVEVLRDYYPSLRAAAALHSDSDLAEGVEEFTERVSRPTDLDHHVRTAAGHAERGTTRSVGSEPEVPGPLGALSYTQQTFKVIHNQMTQGVDVGAASLAFDDVGVRALVTTFYHSQMQLPWFQKCTASTLLGVGRLFARAGELGIRVPVLPTVNALSWPTTPESIAVLRKLAKAQAVAEGTVTVAGKPLSSYPATRQALAGRRRSGSPGPEAAAPLGVATFPGWPQFQGVWNQIAGGGSAAPLALDDVGVKNMMSAFGSGFQQGWLMTVTPEAKVAFARLFARAGELGIALGNLTPQTLNQVAWPVSDEARAALKRLVVAHHLNEAEVMFDGRPLSEDAPVKTVAVAGKLRRSGKVVPAEEPRELGSNGLNQPAYNWTNVANGHPFGQNPAFNDTAVRQFLQNIYGANQTMRPEWIKGATPENKLALARIWARARELATSHFASVEQVNQSGPWPETDEMASVLRRLAKANGLPEEQIDFAGGKLADYKAARAQRPSRARRAGSTVPPEAAAPLGGAPFVVNGYNWQVVSSGGAFGMDPAFNDPSVQEFLTKIYGNRFDPNWFVSAAPENKLAIARIYARSRELGAPLALTSTEINQIPWQATDEMASALRRLATAYGIPESTISFDGSVLSSYKGVPERTAGATARASPPLGTHSPTGAELDRLIAAQDRKLFEISDVSLELLLARKGGILPVVQAFAGHHADPAFQMQVMRMWTHALDIGALSAGDPNLAAYTRQYIQPAMLDHPGAIEALHHLLFKGKLSPASAVLTDGLPLTAKPAFVKLNERLDKVAEGSTAPVLIRDTEAPEKELEARAQRAASVFQHKGGRTLSEKVEALEGLTDLEHGVDFPEVAAQVVAIAEHGPLDRLEFSKLDADQKAKVIAALTREEHLGVATALAGLFLEGGDGELQKALTDIGYDPEDVKRWVGHADGLRKLDHHGLAVALGDFHPEETNDFLLFPLRLELAERGTLDAASLERDFAAHHEADRIGTLRALLDRARRPGTSEGERETVRELLLRVVADGTITEEEAREALAGGRGAVLAPAAERELSAAVAAVAATQELGSTELAGHAEAIERLATVIHKHETLIDPTELVGRALDALYAKDLEKVLPLKEADEEMGGVPPKASGHAERTFTGKTVDVAGITLPVNEEPDRDLRAVPRASAANLVMTETTERNLRNIAVNWRVGQPIMLEGPTSAGKTSAVRYLAYKTQSPYRRINLAYNTDISDLVGRYVGGESRYTRADLEKKTRGELSKLALEYGLEPPASAEAEKKTVAEVLRAQTKPRWVDGPLVRAMRKGEVLLLDEMDLARAEVIDQLGSLFDDDKEIRLTQHHNEIIKPHPNFRLFATGNGSSYAGRGKLSKAQLSRWTKLHCQGLTTKDLTKIMRAKFGETIPDGELAKLIASHDALARAADDGSLGRSLGRVAFSLRNLVRVGQRFVRYRGGALSDDAVMRRETEEVYRGGFSEPEDITAVNDILAATMPYSGKGFYDHLEVKETANEFQIGDVTLRKLNTKHADVPGDEAKLILTKRTKQILYRVAKAIDNGENVLLLGERAAGKTAIPKMLAHILGQPWYRQMIGGSTDTMEIVGGYDQAGWQDGLILRAGRPEGTPGLLLLDEYNMGSSAVLERLNSVLDDERTLVLSEKEGEAVRMHPDFRFFAAGNPPNPRYPGRKKLSAASYNRLTVIQVPDLNDRDEQAEILTGLAQKKHIPAAVAESLVDLQHWITERYEKAELGKTLREDDRPDLSMRQLTSALKVIAEFGPELGYGHAFLRAVESNYASTPDAADNAKILAKAEELRK